MKTSSPLHRRLILLFLSVSFSVGVPLPAFADRIEDIYKRALTDWRHTEEMIDRLRERQALSSYHLNLIEGDVHFNRGEYFHALKFYQRAIHDPKIQDSTAWRRRLLVRIIPCYFYINDMKSTEYFSQMLADAAQASGDVENTAYARFYIGRAKHEAGDPEKGYEQMAAAIDTLAHSRLSDKSRLLYHYQMLRMEYLQADNRNGEAREALETVKRLARQSLPLTPQMRKDVYAHEAVLHERAGRHAQAATYYALFKKTGNGEEYDYKCIAPYLRSKRLYGDMVAMAKGRIAYLRRLNVTETAEMTFILRMLAEGYTGLGQFEAAADACDDLYKLQGRMIDDGKRNGMSELSSVYEMKRMELRMRDKMNRNTTIGIVMVTLQIIFFLLFTYRKSVIHHRSLARKNAQMARTLDRFVAERQRTVAKRMATAVGEEEENSLDKERFDKMWNALVEERLFINPQLSRNTLIADFHIPKNKFSSLFRRYTGSTYLQCFNNLRLEHSLTLLREHPHYTIESIAEDCGMAPATFYRLFVQKYGMTPAEYRAAKQNARKKGDIPPKD